MFFICSKRKLGKKESISLAELTNEPYILLEEGHYSEPMAAFKRQISLYSCNFLENTTSSFT